MSDAPKITALAPWFGSNRMLADAVGEELRGCKWVGIPFAGGMTELVHIDARTIVANDLHQHVINLARVVRDEKLCRQLRRKLQATLFHPDEFRAAQDACKESEAAGDIDGSIESARAAVAAGEIITLPPGYDVIQTPDPRVERAAAYFTATWMGRNGEAGTKREFETGMSIRWNAGGGDSCVRFRSAIESLVEWRRLLRRCTFQVSDCFAFLEKCQDVMGHGIYVDPPFPTTGARYKHAFTESDHRRLAEVLSKNQSARVVCRFYDHPLVQELYPEGPYWTWRRLVGRKQTNAEAPEVLVINGVSNATIRPVSDAERMARGRALQREPLWNEGT